MRTASAGSTGCVLEIQSGGREANQPLTRHASGHHRDIEGEGETSFTLLDHASVLPPLWD